MRSELNGEKCQKLDHVPRIGEMVVFTRDRRPIDCYRVKDVAWVFGEDQTSPTKDEQYVQVSLEEE